MEGARLIGGEGKKAAAAAAAAAMPRVVRPKPNLADHVFKFCMMRTDVTVARLVERSARVARLVTDLKFEKSSVVLGSCYFVVLCYIAISNPQLEKLCLLPFFGVAVAAPLYAAALLKECDR